MRFSGQPFVMTQTLPDRTVRRPDAVSGGNKRRLWPGSVMSIVPPTARAHFPQHRSRKTVAALLTYDSRWPAPKIRWHDLHFDVMIRHVRQRPISTTCGAFRRIRPYAVNAIAAAPSVSDDSQVDNGSSCPSTGHLAHTGRRLTLEKSVSQGVAVSPVDSYMHKLLKGRREWPINNPRF